MRGGNLTFKVKFSFYFLNFYFKNLTRRFKTWFLKSNFERAWSGTRWTQLLGARRRRTAASTQLFAAPREIWKRSSFGASKCSSSAAPQTQLFRTHGNLTRGGTWRLCVVVWGRTYVRERMFVYSILYTVYSILYTRLKILNCLTISVYTLPRKLIIGIVEAVNIYYIWVNTHTIDTI